MALISLRVAPLSVVSHQSSPSNLTRLFIKCRVPLRRFISAPVRPCGATVRFSLSTVIEGAFKAGSYYIAQVFEMAKAIGFKWSENTEPKFLCETAKLYQLWAGFHIAQRFIPLIDIGCLLDVLCDVGPRPVSHSCRPPGSSFAKPLPKICVRGVTIFSPCT